MDLETSSCSLKSVGACLWPCLTTNPQFNNQGSSGVYCHVLLLTKRVPDNLPGFFWNKRESEQSQPCSISHIPCSPQSYSSRTCMSTFVYPLRRPVGVLLFVLGFSLGEYGCVSRQKVQSTSKTLTPAPVCKKVWAVCLLVSSSSCSQVYLDWTNHSYFYRLLAMVCAVLRPLLFRTQHLWLQY